MAFQQLDLFGNNLKLSDIVEFVKSQGAWQDKNCYKTAIYKDGETIIIGNEKTYKVKNEDNVEDYTILKIKDNKCKISSVSINEISAITMKKYPYMFDLMNYEDYLINVDINLKEKEAIYY